MRLRITQQPSGSVDGIPLDDFIVDFVYEVGTMLGSYLLAQGLAEPVPEEIPGLVPPLTETRFSVIAPSEPLPEPAEAPSGFESLSEAADRPKRQPKR